MYLIAKGECKVILSDSSKEGDSEEEEGQNHVSSLKNKLVHLFCNEENEKKEGILRPGHYFGEISLIFGCERTAKVIAKKYCTLAKLTKAMF